MEGRDFRGMRAKMLKDVRASIKSEYANEEYALIQSINAYDETSKSYNLVFERLTEWYGIYFPEVKIPNPESLARLVAVLNDKEALSKDAINEIINDPDKSESIFNKASASMGRSMNEGERSAILAFAKMSMDMASAMDGLDTYIKATAEKLMPNATFLTDDKIAAELLAKAGSLERLATMPASTIQLLGAEKALFKHIKFGSKPPKYGILFKMAEISNAPRNCRGKIARAYATKISIGLKGDFFTKKFIGEELKKNLQSTIEKIKKASEGKPERRSNERPTRPLGGYRRPGRGYGSGGGMGGGARRQWGDGNRGDRKPQWKKRQF
ncbi:MAG: NOP58 family protein [Candidatus Micrarchaeota archaeon]|nr:NOP58 family protein [Candidatus Micrarchaeota archaeon]